ncbi:hypothetical protein N7468_007715 [Penicillium chermesinum]|uniref:Zn(2)-C6 fungal-type domain-containing protein n=1 Tax=Penicillium chermesinum TaxID=63820 RepID=A0A9W9TME9_9EURO|nr:uncharacterized protein N7468_007715 [Penicillium chermesinum]KAJ5226490.1 hypothetical protein N7468_007715 [Penicillium chermesinum]
MSGPDRLPGAKGRMWRPSSVDDFKVKSFPAIPSSPASPPPKSPFPRLSGSSFWRGSEMDASPGFKGLSSSGPRATRGPLAGGRQITRNRASYSCHACRRRKVKCDKVHPICGNCAKTGADCVYDTSSQKQKDTRDTASRNQGTKRRRGTPRSWEDDVRDLQSTYGPARHTEGSAQSPDKSDPRAIEARLNNLMSVIERIGGTTQAYELAEKHAKSPSATVESALLDELRQSNARSAKNASPRPSSPARAAMESSGDEFPIPSGQATDLVDPIGSLNLGHLSLEDGGRSRYVGTTYWAYISHEINDLNQLLRDQTRSHDHQASESTSEDLSDPMNGRGARRSSIGSSPMSGTGRSRVGSFPQSVIFPSAGESPYGADKSVEPEMLEHVPTRRQSHILYKGFMSGVHAISPVVHPPTVLKLYNAFWDWYDYSSYSGEPCPNVSFIPLLYAIWYGGSVTISLRTIQTEFPSASRFSLSSMYNEEVTHWLTKISFPRSPSLHGLAAYLIVQTILSKEEEPLTSSLFVSMAMRVAQTMGLHRDPAKFGIEPCEAETRRRMWWHILHMDGVVAMSSGLPPMLSDENYWDVRETSEIKDTLIGTSLAETYEELVATNQRVPDNPDDPSLCGGSSMVNVYYLTARGKYAMARAVRRILRIQLGTQPVTRMDMEDLRSILLDLQLKLNSMVHRIPEGMPERTSGAASRAMSMSRSPPIGTETAEEVNGEGLNGCAEQYHSPVLVSFHKWAKIILGLYIDKAFCVAYQPFLKNARSRIWPAARQSAIRHCHGFMEKFIQLATDADFQPFHWSWPGNHQPMHATMIMLIDLYERPYSPEAPRSRAFIDRILAISGPDGGVVGGEDGISLQRPLKDGGREAWDMIRRLRQKAWQKAGLNPEVLWTEQDQVLAGITSHSDELRHPHPQLTDFNRLFYNMTRNHLLSGSSTSGGMKPSPLRYSYQPPVETANSLPMPPRSHTHAASTIPAATLSPAATATSPDVVSPSGTSASHSMPADRSQPLAAAGSQPLQPVGPGVAQPSQPTPFMDSLSPHPNPTSVPTPPSMVDPNLNFDWDQWDAVFGQHLPVADELMELDPPIGLEFANFGGPLTDTQESQVDPHGMSTPGTPDGWIRYST